jgi:predicted choloylglycine hydrolase
MTFQKPAVYPSIRQKAPNLVGHLDGAISSLGTAQTVNLLRYAPDDRSSPRALAGKQLLKN